MARALRRLPRSFAGRSRRSQSDRMREDWRGDMRDILATDIAFIDDCLKKGVISFAALQEFTQKQGPKLKHIIAWAAQTQVAHWRDVVAGWKKELGADWEKTYAASNTIYVARQNNILFSVLAQFFGPDAINSRLMLIETISFTTTPEDMLDSLTRIIGDRAVGGLFFGNSASMDFELMGGDACDAIVAEAGKRGMTPLLPPKVPFGSKQWPTLITPGPGPQHQLRQIAQQFKQTGAANLRPRPELKPGTRLVRGWQGRNYEVLVLDDGSPDRARITARYPRSRENHRHGVVGAEAASVEASA